MTGLAPGPADCALTEGLVRSHPMNVETTVRASNTAVLDVEREIFAEQRRNRGNALQATALRVLWLSLFLGAWYLASHRGIVDPLATSIPEDVGRAFVDHSRKAPSGSS